MHDSQGPTRGKTGVLFVNSPERFGADTAIHALIMKSLDRSRFDVHVACSAGAPGARTLSFGRLSAIPDLHVRPSDFGPTLSGFSTLEKASLVLRRSVPTIASFAGLARYVRQHGITVLHSTDRPRDAVACSLLSTLTGAKSVIHLHVKCADWMSRSARKAMARADALVGVSQFVARSLVDNGYPAQKTHAVLNSIDLSTWDYRIDAASVRREFGISPSAPVLACAARLFRGKGQDEMIRAIPAIRQEFPDVRLLIIGEDDRQAMKTSFTAELKVLAQELGVQEQVIFTGFRSDMPALLAASDLFALPTFEEPCALVFLEAMAMKKAVIALDSGGTPELIQHGKSGLLSAPGDSAGLAANLLTLLRDPELRLRMGEYGRRQVETHFAPSRMARDTEKVYAALTS